MQHTIQAHYGRSAEQGFRPQQPRCRAGQLGLGGSPATAATFCCSTGALWQHLLDPAGASLCARRDDGDGRSSSPTFVVDVDIACHQLALLRQSSPRSWRNCGGLACAANLPGSARRRARRLPDLEQSKQAAASSAFSTRAGVPPAPAQLHRPACAIRSAALHAHRRNTPRAAPRPPLRALYLSPSSRMTHTHTYTRQVHGHPGSAGCCIRARRTMPGGHRGACCMPPIPRQACIDRMLHAACGLVCTLASPHAP